MIFQGGGGGPDPLTGSTHVVYATVLPDVKWLPFIFNLISYLDERRLVILM